MSVRTSTENLVANAKVRFLKSDGPAGTFPHGFISEDDMNAYTVSHPWPYSDQVKDKIRSEIDQITDTQGRAAAYPALNDALSGTEIFSLQTDFHALDVPVAVRATNLGAQIQVEGRASIEQEFVEAYGPGESVQGPATCMVRYLYADGGVLKAVDITTATVTFTFPAGPPVVLSSAGAFGAYATPFQLPQSPGRYTYTVTATGQVLLPNGSSAPISAQAVGSPVWFVVLSVDPGGPYYIPPNGTNACWAGLTGTVLPPSYLDRTGSGTGGPGNVMAHYFGFEAPDNRSGASGSGTIWMPIQIQRPSGAPAYASSTIPPQCLSPAPWPVQLVLERTWTQGSAPLKSKVQLITGEEVALLVSCTSQNCILDKSGPVTVTLQAVVKGSNPQQALVLTDWDAHLFLEDEGDPSAAAEEIGLAREDGNSRIYQEISQADISARISPYLREQAWLTNGCGSLNPEPTDVKVVIKNIMIRNTHTTCTGSLDASPITLPLLPDAAQWTVSLNGVPTPDPGGHSTWAPGTYQTPFPPVRPTKTSAWMRTAAGPICTGTATSTLRRKS